MTAIATDPARTDATVAPLPLNAPQDPVALHQSMTRVWADEPGWRGVFTSVNHGTIGRRFMLTSAVFFGIAGVLAMLIRAQLATRQGGFLDTALYNQIFTLHGSIMMFLFAIPMLEGLALWLLPKILGARDMAFPRLSALGFWCYLFGGSIITLSLLAGVAPDGGWFMYVPLADRTHTPGVNADVWLLGVTFVEISAIAAAVEITVTILRTRAPGMALTQMPLMAWYLLGTSVMMLVGFPPLILGSLLLEAERAFGWPFFDVMRGGDPLLWQHLFWLFGHPEVYIIFLPAAGVLSTLIPAICRVPILGYGPIVAAILGLVFLSFGLWVHHMFTVGIPHMALAFFSAASALVAVPTAVQIFAWIGTMWAGRPSMTLPMLYIMGFFATFVLGGLTGVMLAMVPFNWQAHDSAFVTAHLHYVLVGGFVFPMMAGIIWWLPLMSGKTEVPGLFRAAFWLIFVGFHGTFFLMHLTGLLGMPRRIDSYPGHAEWEALNLISSIFGMVQSAGFGLFALAVVAQVLFGRRAERDPWQAGTLDWAMALPAPAYNFASLPDARMTAADGPALAAGRGALPGAGRDWRETLVVGAARGEVAHVAVLPGNTALPIWTAAAIGTFFAAMLAGLYAWAPLGLVLTAWAAWRWGDVMGTDRDHPPVPVAPGVTAPVHWQVRETLAHSGMRALLVADGTLHASFLFGMAFLAVVAPGWPAPVSKLGVMQAGWAMAGLASLAVGSLAARQVERARTPGWGLAGVIAGMAALAAMAMVARGLDDPTAHARDSLRAMALVLAAAHGVVSLMLAARTWADAVGGRMSAQRRGAAPVWRMMQDFTLATAAVSTAVVVLTGT